ncbi:Putative F-box/LRR-repeat protein At5g02700 [Linum grandiflorum]
MVRRSKRIQNRIDRLSELPESILHHILSFVDTKSSVRTSVLSKKWTSVWKHVPILSFGRAEALSDLHFEQQVDRVLSLRSDSSSIHRVTVDFGFSQQVEWVKELCDRIVNYAASHGVRHLCVQGHPSFPAIKLLSVPYQSLKVLEFELTYIRITDIGLFSGLQLLQSLTLTECCFALGHRVHDAFINYPGLESLKLDNCHFFERKSEARVLIVNGPKLLNLEIFSTDLDRLEIDAPKLQSFTLEIDSSDHRLPDVSKSNLPCLSRANIELMAHKYKFFAPASKSGTSCKRQLLLDGCATLFKTLHNVQFLGLRVRALKLIVDVCNSAKDQSSPFNRMKVLNLKFLEGSLGIPDEVISYFFGGSPYDEDQHFIAEKLC